MCASRLPSPSPSIGCLLCLTRAAIQVRKAFGAPSSDLADAAETRASRGHRFRFVLARVGARGHCRSHAKIFVRSPMRFAGATSRRDWSDLDSV